MSQALRIKLAIESTAKRVEALYEVICDGKNLCELEGFNDALDASFVKFMELANASKDPTALTLAQSKYLVELTNFLQSAATRQGARKPDPRAIAAARGAAGSKAVQVANRKNPPREQFPVF